MSNELSLDLLQVKALAEQQRARGAQIEREAILADLQDDDDQEAAASFRRSTSSWRRFTSSWRRPTFK